MSDRTATAKLSRLSIRVSPAFLWRMRELAAQEQTTVTELVQRVLTEYADRQAEGPKGEVERDG